MIKEPPAAGNDQADIQDDKTEKSAAALTLAPGTAIGRELERYARAAAGAYAGNTERALRADSAVFSAWCRQAGVAPLPASAATVAAFVDAMGATRAPATVRRYVSSIATLHKAARLANPTADPLVKLALKRLHRRRGRRQRQAQGVTLEVRERLLAAAGSRPIDLRNKALVAVAYDTLARRSELVGIRIEDLTPDADGSATVLIRRSKTDQHGDGSVAYLAPDTVAHLRRWLTAAGLASGPVFYSVSKAGRPTRPLAHRSHDPGAEVARIFKQMARAAGLPAEAVAAISGHSTRVGSTQDMLEHGIELPAIMQAGRWQTPTMVSRYGERLIARRGGAARLARRQRRGGDDG